MLKLERIEHWSPRSNAVNTEGVSSRGWLTVYKDALTASVHHALGKQCCVCLFTLSCVKTSLWHVHRKKPTAENRERCLWLLPGFEWKKEKKKKAAVMTSINLGTDTEVHSGSPHTHTNTHIKLNTHKAPKPQQPELQPSSNLNLIPLDTSIRAGGDKGGHVRWTGFLPVSILQLNDTTLAFRSESVRCHWNATCYHSAVKSGSIQGRLRGVEWAVRRTNPREASQIHQKWHSHLIMLINRVEEPSAIPDFMTLWIFKGNL